MACIDPFLQFDDESFALALQLEEIEAQRELQSGKWTEDSPPDYVLAFNDFEAEMRKAIFMIEHLKFAHSIAKAVNSDAFAIEASRAEETQAVEDRDFALGLNEDENLPFQDFTNCWSCLASERSPLTGIISCELQKHRLSVASPVASLRALRPHDTLSQKAVLEHLPQLKVECSVCGKSVHPHSTVPLACNDIYCKSCLKEFFLRVE